jgi:hypothetical protein
MTKKELYNIFQDSEFINKAYIRAISNKIKKGDVFINKADEENRYLSSRIRKYDNAFATILLNDEIEKNRENILKVEKRLWFLKKQRKSLYRALKEKKEIEEDKTITPIEDIKKVPIKEVLNLYGIEINKQKKFKVRNENTPSCSFNEDKNLWVDHGNRDYGGSVIDLIMILDGCSTGEAIKKLKDLI